ncbi:MAG: hypothetical protein AABX04_02860, partial [Nanoarchaeota archaeon]
CKQLCEPCEGDYQCEDGSGKDLCINFPDSKSLYYNKKKFCAQDCSNDACPTGYDCMDVFSEKTKTNVKQCFSLFYGKGVIASCILPDACDPNNYISKCENGKSYNCAKTSGLVRVTNCQYYGLNCGFSEYYKTNICFGNSKQGEPCPEWFDCDYSSGMDNCVSSAGGVGFYCTIGCVQNSDCPADYNCKILTDGEKACVKN